MAGHTVQFAGHSEDQFRAVLAVAATEGRDDDVFRAIRRVVELLEANPLSCGDPMYRIARLQLLVRHVSVDPLYIEYGVHEAYPLVLIRFVASFRDAAGRS